MKEKKIYINERETHIVNRGDVSRACVLGTNITLTMHSTITRLSDLGIVCYIRRRRDKVGTTQLTFGIKTFWGLTTAFEPNIDHIQGTQVLKSTIDGGTIGGNDKTTYGQQEQSQLLLKGWG